MLTHTDIHHFIGAYKEKDVAADIDNIFLSNQGWCYRHYKEELKGKWWDEIIIAGDGRSFDSPGDPNPGFERADGIKDFEYKLGHPPFKLDNVGMIGNPNPVVGVEDHLVARYAGTVDDVVWQWTITGGAYTITNGTLTSEEINVTFDEIKEYTVSLKGSSVQAGGVMIEDTETFHCIPHPITISNPVGPSKIKKGETAVYGVSVDTFAPDVSITWSFDTTDYTIVHGSLNSAAVEVEFTKLGNFVASVNVVSPLAGTDVTKTVNTSVTVAAFIIDVTGPTTVIKSDAVSYKVTSTEADSVYNWSIDPGDFSLISGSLSSDEIEVTFDKKGLFNVGASVQSDYQEQTKTDVVQVSSETPRLQLTIDAPKSANKGDIITLRANASAVKSFTPDYVYQWTITGPHTVVSGSLTSPELEIQLDDKGQYKFKCEVSSDYLEGTKEVTKTTNVTLKTLTSNITGTKNTEKKDNGTYKSVTNAPDPVRSWVITPNTYNLVSGTSSSENIEVDFLKSGIYNISCEVTSAYLENTKTDVINTTVFIPTHNVGFSGPSSALKGETKTYTVTTNAPDAVYKWTSTGNTITGTGSSVDITFPNGGSSTVSVEVESDYLEDTTTKNKSVSVTIPRITASLAGPTSANKAETKTYTVTTNAPDAVYSWSSTGNTITGSGKEVDVTFNSAGNNTVNVDVTSAYHEDSKSLYRNVNVAKPPFTVSLSGNTTPIVGVTNTYEVISNQSDITVIWPSSTNYSVSNAVGNTADITVSSGSATIKADVTSAFAEDTKTAELRVNTIKTDGPGNITISGPPDGTPYTKLAVGTKYSYTFTQDGPNADSTFYSQVSVSPSSRATINSNPLFKHEADITFNNAATTYTIEAEMTGDQGSKGSGFLTVETANKTLTGINAPVGETDPRELTTHTYTITIAGTATDCTGYVELYETNPSGHTGPIGPVLQTIPVDSSLTFDVTFPSNNGNTWVYYALSPHLSSNDAATTIQGYALRVQCYKV
jgi:hypothetical protein